MHGDCSIREFRSLLRNSAKGSNNVTKKHHAVKSNPYIDMITFIRHFPLIVSVPAFRFRSVPVFLEFYLPVKVLCSPTNAAAAAKLQPCKVCCRDNKVSL